MSLRRMIAVAVGLTATVVLAVGLARAPQRARPAAIGGPFTLVDDQGRTVTEASLLGKPSVIYFGYTFCPEVCPTTLTDLTRWMHELGPDADRLSYVFVTVDPQRDTVKLMRDYVSSFDPRLRGFTGTPEQVAAAAKAYRVYYRKIPTSDGGYEMDHSAFLYLMGSDGKFATFINYGEKDASAIRKLKRLIAMGRTS